MKWSIVVLVIATACSRAAESNKPPALVREPAVAGAFYPAEPAQLSQMLDGLLASANTHTIEGELRAIVCPHAGYVFSGPIAAQAYRLLPGRAYDTVVVLAPSHYALFRGASVCAADIYRTPLGDVPLSPKGRQWAKAEPFVLEPKCVAQNPQTRQPSEATPERWEHSGEVQVPFLQKTLRNFSLVSIVTGEVDPEKLARALADRLDDKMLLVVSTDLSHYHPYDVAREMDTRCVTGILALDPDPVKPDSACGRTGVLTLLHLAKLKGWKAKLLDYRNSGDTAGNKDAVVGYAAIAFYTPAPQSFNRDERKQLLELARKAISNDKLPELTNVPPKFAETKGCFVTLTERGQLRGCIGHILPQEALYRAVMDNALSAAKHDYRFSPVQPDELDKIEIEISVLTVPEPLQFSSPDDLLAKLRPYRDGVVLQMAGHGATYLPQVWEQIPDKVQFLDTLAQKAGAAAGDWRKPGTQVHIYHVESFKESEM